MFAFTPKTITAGALIITATAISAAIIPPTIIVASAGTVITLLALVPQFRHIVLTSRTAPFTNDDDEVKYQTQMARHIIPFAIIAFVGVEATILATKMAM